MEPLRLLVSDLDGTLLTSDRALTPATLDAVAALRGAGVRLAVTTSRPPRGAWPVLAPLALDLPVAGFNGGLLAAADGAVTEAHVLDDATARRALAVLEEHGLQTWLHTAETWFVTDADAPHAVRERAALDLAPVVVENLAAHVHGTLKITGLHDDPDRMDAAHRALEQALGDAVSARRSQTYSLDVTHPAADKGRALERLADLAGVPVEATAAIGDGGNDVPMLRRAGLGIAMGNAAPSTRAAAAHGTAANDADGFAAAVEHVLLPRAAATPTDAGRLLVYPHAAALVDAAARRVVRAAREAVAARGRFLLALAGGGTPRPVYERLASAPLRDQVPWDRVHVLFGDERCVPPDHPDSNFGMARRALLDHVPVPPTQIHRLRGEDDPQAAAAAYAEVLRGLADGDGPPVLDLIQLGLGDDAHTASLFPGTPALHERTRWVAAQPVPKLHAWRLTLTPPVLNAARAVDFLVSGAGKREALRAVRTAPHDPDLRPAQLVRPAAGALTWLTDADAAGKEHP